MTSTQPDPSPRSDGSASGGTDAIDGGGAPPEAPERPTPPLDPEAERELREAIKAKRRAERREAARLERQAARREARRAERQARREAEKEAKREAQWDEALANARRAKLAEGLPPPSERVDSPSGREPFAVFRSTGTGLPPLRTYFHQLRKRRGLIWHLARSEMKGENYNTFFGQLWLILGPLMLAGVYVLGRSVIRPIGSVGERNFLIAHLVGAVFLFQFTAKSMNAGSRALIRNKNMILNTPMPASVYPLSSALRSLFDLVPLLLTLFALRIVLDQPTTWVYIFLLPIIGIQLLFNMGLMFGTATLMVFFRDFGNMLSFASRLWLWTTPVLYTTQEIPEPARKFLMWNPLYPMFAMYEQVFAGEVPSLGYALWALAWAVPIFVVSVIVFLRKERDFAVRL